MQYEKFLATQDPQTGEIKVTWGLKNGFSAYLREPTDKIYEAEAEIGSMAIGSTLLMSSAGLLPDINGTITLARGVCEDSYYVRELNRDPFPSLEIYHYKNGQHFHTIGTFPETEFLGTFAPFWGLSPIAPNEIFRDGIPTWP